MLEFRALGFESMAAPKGNKNAAKGKQFQDALRRALNADGREGLKNIATKLVDAAEAGEGWAIKEVADRLDGKPAQVVAGDSDQPLKMQIGWLTQ